MLAPTSPLQGELFFPASPAWVDNVVYGMEQPKMPPQPGIWFSGLPLPLASRFPSLPWVNPWGSHPLPTQSRTSFISCLRAGISAATPGTLQGTSVSPPPRRLGGRLGHFSPCCLGKTLLAGEEKEEDDGVGRMGEAVSSLVCKGERRRRVVPTLPGLPFCRCAAQTGGEALAPQT